MAFPFLLFISTPSENKYFARTNSFWVAAQRFWVEILHVQRTLLFLLISTHVLIVLSLEKWCTSRDREPVQCTKQMSITSNHRCEVSPSRKSLHEPFFVSDGQTIRFLPRYPSAVKVSKNIVILDHKSFRSSRSYIGRLFNRSSWFSVPTWKTLCSQPELLLKNIFQ